MFIYYYFVISKTTIFVWTKNVYVYTILYNIIMSFIFLIDFKILSIDITNLLLLFYCNHRKMLLNGINLYY